jgi:hypothetical protein
VSETTAKTSCLWPADYHDQAGDAEADSWTYGVFLIPAVAWDDVLVNESLQLG